MRLFRNVIAIGGLLYKPSTSLDCAHHCQERIKHNLFLRKIFQCCLINGSRVSTLHLTARWSSRLQMVNAPAPSESSWSSSVEHEAVHATTFSGVLSVLLAPPADGVPSGRSKAPTLKMPLFRAIFFRECPFVPVAQIESLYDRAHFMTRCYKGAKDQARVTLQGLKQPQDVLPIAVLSRLGGSPENAGNSFTVVQATDQTRIYLSHRAAELTKWSSVTTNQADGSITLTILERSWPGNVVLFIHCCIAPSSTTGVSSIPSSLSTLSNSCELWFGSLTGSGSSPDWLTSFVLALRLYLAGVASIPPAMATLMSGACSSVAATSSPGRRRDGGCGLTGRSWHHLILHVSHLSLPVHLIPAFSELESALLRNHYLCLIYSWVSVVNTPALEGQKIKGIMQFVSGARRARTRLFASAFLIHNLDL